MEALISGNGDSVQRLVELGVHSPEGNLSGGSGEHLNKSGLHNSEKRMEYNRRGRVEQSRTAEHSENRLS
jgi:hypothetical protein